MREAKTAKSERTRATIKAAARGLFEQQGYERTTIRNIAAVAQIDPALVIRYFGSKENLFAGVVQPDLRLPDLHTVDPAKIGETLVAHFLDLWEGEAAGGGMPVLLRSAASNEAAAAQLRSIFARQVLPMLGSTGDEQGASNRAGLISAQLLGLAMTRYVVKLPPVVAMERDFIIKQVGATIQRYATLD